ncbi:kinase-like protein [Auriculariales sp. MPI-PUGE-AT-0066]|nr:kinase-like protein [Auriculariales sp. MPI-PUGE-AT-0066]
MSRAQASGSLSRSRSQESLSGQSCSSQGTYSIRSQSESSSDGEEDVDDYAEGGYLPVNIGDVFHERYIVVRKLGWGHFSTVWLARDVTNERHVALKVVRSAKSYAETARDEIDLLRRLARADPAHAGYAHVMRILDHFLHPSSHHGKPVQHYCMVFEVLGESLMGFLTPEAFLDRGVPIDTVKQIAKQVLLGLDYMHRSAGLIHTDLKPENVLICVEDVERAIRADLARNPPERAPTATKTIRNRSVSEAARLREICITASQPLPSPKGSRALDYFTQQRHSVDSAIDGLATLSLSPSPRTPGDDKQIGLHHLSSITPALDKFSGLHSPLDDHMNMNPDTRITVKIADIGNSTPIEKHYSDDIQTRQYRSPEVIMGAKWGPSVDVWSLACIVFELLTGGDILFQPQGTPEYTKDDDHLAQIYELCGPYPRHMIRDAYYSKHFFTSRGELRNIPSNRLRPWPLEDVLRDKYLFSKRKAREIAAFITPMLRSDPSLRASAQEMLAHPWLAGVVAQGEVDAAERLNEVLRRQLEQLPQSPLEGPVSALSVQTSKAQPNNASAAAKKKKKKR